MRPLPQVEERLRFYEEGVAPRKNLDVMKASPAGAAAACQLLFPPILPEATRAATACFLMCEQRCRAPAPWSLTVYACLRRRCFLCRK